MPPTTSIFRRATTRWSRGCATPARSSSPRRTPRSTTDAGPAIRAARIIRPRCLPRCSAISAAPGPAIRAIRTTRRAPHRSARARAQASRSSTNLVMCSLCEETGQSCRGPANHNSVALILPHKAHLSFLGGAIGAEIYNDRAGIHCRAVTDAVRVLDALKDPVNGYYDPRDIFTTVPRSSLPTEPYAKRDHRAASRARSRACASASSASSWSSTRKVDEPIVDAAAAEMKAMLGRASRRHAGGVGDPGMGRRSRDREHDDDLRSRDRGDRAGAVSGFPLSAERRTESRSFRTSPRSVRPTPFAPGVTKGTGTMASADWMVRWAEGLEPTPRNLTLRSLLGGGGDTGSRTLPLPHPAVPDAARQGLGRPRLQGNAGRTGRRSTRDRNSGATTSARRSRTGRR